MATRIRVLLRRFYLRRLRGKRWVAWGLVSYIVLLGAFSFVGDRGLLKSYRLWKQCQALDADILTLESDIQELWTDVDRFRNDRRTIEKFAREKLHLAGEDEIQYIFR